MIFTQKMFIFHVVLAIKILNKHLVFLSSKELENL